VNQSATSVHCSGFQARYLAAADGLHSPVRAALGLARHLAVRVGGESAVTM
jgi:2-polyprenyl-6-methoxyphenol hydroxylase-like FAD-dependent oxidoreductase